PPQKYPCGAAAQARGLSRPCRRQESGLTAEALLFPCISFFSASRCFKGREAPLHTWQTVEKARSMHSLAWDVFLQQVLHNLPGQDQSRHAGNKGQAPWGGTARGAFLVSLLGGGGNGGFL